MDKNKVVWKLRMGINMVVIMLVLGLTTCLIQASDFTKSSFINSIVVSPRNLSNGTYRLEFTTRMERYRDLRKDVWTETSTSATQKEVLTVDCQSYRWDRRELNASGEETGLRDLSIYNGQETITLHQNAGVYPAGRVIEGNKIYNWFVYDNGFVSPLLLQKLTNFKFSTVNDSSRGSLLEVTANHDLNTNKNPMYFRWIMDPNKGFAVYASEVRLGKFDGPIYTKFEVEELAEISPNIWFPKKIQVSQYNFDEISGKIKLATVYHRTLQKGEVNILIPKGTFEVNFPPDTLVGDEIKNNQYIVPGGKLDTPSNIK